MLGRSPGTGRGANVHSGGGVALTWMTVSRLTTENTPGGGATPSLRAGGVTRWLGTVPAGVCTPFSGTVVVQETLDGPTSIEDELIADIEQQIEAVDGDREEALPTTGGEPP